MCCQGVNGQNGSGSEGQGDGSSWRSLFPKQLEMWRSAYSDKAATGLQGGSSGLPQPQPAPLTYAERVKESAKKAASATPGAASAASAAVEVLLLISQCP